MIREKLHQITSIVAALKRTMRLGEFVTTWHRLDWKTNGRNKICEKSHQITSNVAALKRTMRLGECVTTWHRLIGRKNGTDVRREKSHQITSNVAALKRTMRLVKKSRLGILGLIHKMEDEKHEIYSDASMDFITLFRKDVA